MEIVEALIAAGADVNFHGQVQSPLTIQNIPVTICNIVSTLCQLLFVSSLIGHRSVKQLAEDTNILWNY